MSVTSVVLRNRPAYLTDHSVEKNQGLARFFIKKYRGLDLDRHVLESAVYEGIRKASLRFDPNRGAKFSYYAGIKVSAEITAALESKLKEILGSLFLAKLALHMGRVERRYFSEFGHYPSDPQTAKIMGATIKSVVKIRRLLAERPVSLQSPRGKSEKLRLIDCVPDGSVETPLEELLRREAQGEFEAALQSLPPRQEYIIRSHYGIGDEDEHTLEEIGEILGNRERGRPLTRENIRQLENRAFDEVRANFPSLAANL